MGCAILPPPSRPPRRLVARSEALGAAVDHTLCARCGAAQDQQSEATSPPALASTTILCTGSIRMISASAQPSHLCNCRRFADAATDAPGAGRGVGSECGRLSKGARPSSRARQWGSSSSTRDAVANDDPHAGLHTKREERDGSTNDADILILSFHGHVRIQARASVHCRKAQLPWASSCRAPFSRHPILWHPSIGRCSRHVLPHLARRIAIARRGPREYDARHTELQRDRSLHRRAGGRAAEAGEAPPALPLQPLEKVAARAGGVRPAQVLHWTATPSPIDCRGCSSTRPSSSRKAPTSSVITALQPWLHYIPFYVEGEDVIEVLANVHARRGGACRRRARAGVCARAPARRRAHVLLAEAAVGFAHRLAYKPMLAQRRTADATRPGRTWSAGSAAGLPTLTIGPWPKDYLQAHSLSHGGSNGPCARAGSSARRRGGRAGA